MTEIIVRSATIDDLDGILEVEQESFSTPWPKDAMEMEIVKNELARYLVADYNGEILGYAGVWMILNEGHITNIAVKKEARGQGVGDMLMSSMVLLCDMNNLDFLTLEVRESNLAAQGLYTKHGFVMEGVRKNYYRDNNEDGIIMNRVKVK